MKHIEKDNRLLMFSWQFGNDAQYLERALAFLKKYQWIYNCRNTDILLEGVLSNFTQDWIDYFNALSVEELHEFIRGNVKEGAPLDLKLMIDEITCLRPKIKCDALQPENCVKNVALSRKKSHEIELLAPIIDDVCRETGCDLIIDIGSGVGHLPHVLHTKFNHKILALEASKKLVESAKRQHRESIGHLVFEEMFVNQSSHDDIENLASKHFGAGKKFCLTGLHACADLSVEVLRLFTNMNDAQALVIMPCCYHRMLPGNIPVSVKGKKLFNEYDAHAFIKQPFLRLACQQTMETFVRMSPEEHRRHAQHCMNRAILQLVAEMENCSVRRLKRKSGKSHAADVDEGFREYLNNLAETHELVGRDPSKPISGVTDGTFLTRMQEKWTRYKGDCWQVEVLMGLQAAVQAICENVILLDRVEFLKENRIHCYNRKITNDCVSPRCWALVAKKNVL